MSLHDDYLAQARHLAGKDKTRPKQASLRRAISTSYYALFHLLTWETAKLFASNAALNAVLNRSLNHGDMAKVSRQIISGKLPKSFNAWVAAQPVPVIVPELDAIARTFLALQQERHEADYNLDNRWSRQQALRFIARAEQAFEDWSKIRRTDVARIFLGCFLLWDKWDKER